MTFYREGKKLNYLEVIQTLESLIKKEILNQLEKQEVAKLFMRIMSFSNELAESYLTEKGYKVVSIRQTFLTLSQLKVVTQYETWRKAIELYEQIKSEEYSKDTITEFMSKMLLEAMKELNHILK